MKQHPGTQLEMFEGRIECVRPCDSLSGSSPNPRSLDIDLIDMFSCERDALLFGVYLHVYGQSSHALCVEQSLPYAWTPLRYLLV